VLSVHVFIFKDFGREKNVWSFVSGRMVTLFGVRRDYFLTFEKSLSSLKFMKYNMKFWQSLITKYTIDGLHSV